MSNKKILFSVAFLTIAIFTTTGKAQVIIGGDRLAPKSFSLLELITTDYQGGLRLPQLTTAERDALDLASDPEAAKGLLLYNTTTNCVDYWNGSEWISFSDILLISEAGSNNQTVCSGSTIAAIIYQFTDAAGASVTGLPAGVTGNWDGASNTLTISGTPEASGTFAYTVTADGSSTVGGKITVTANFTQANPAAATICYNTAHTFTVAVATGGSGTLTYQWQSSTNNSTWSNISGATSANYTTPALTASTYYRRQAIRATCGGTITSTAALVTVEASFTQANPTAATICYNTAHTFTVAAATGGSGTLTYQWQSSTNNSTWSNISGATSANYTTANLTANMYYRRQATRTTCGSTISSASALVTVEANFTQSNPAAATITCGATATHTFTVAAATGGSGTLTYQWQSSSNNSTWSNISGATSANYTTAALTANTYYRRQATRTTCGGTITSASALVTFQTGQTCCGAYIASGVWKRFMCHNLGATESADPFTPSWQINGAYYQWGRSAKAKDAPGSSDGTDDTNIAWSSAIPSGTFGSTASNSTSKTAQDPCPTGYRIPNYDEWNYLRQNNTMTNVGGWTSATNSWTGVKFGNNLFLPAAGSRRSSDGTLGSRGSVGNYWSTRAASVAEDAYCMTFFSSGTYMNYSYRPGGFSVRCIEQ